MKLKKFLIPFLLCSLFCFIPKTYALTSFPYERFDGTVHSTTAPYELINTYTEVKNIQTTAGQFMDFTSVYMTLYDGTSNSVTHVCDGSTHIYRIDYQLFGWHNPNKTKSEWVQFAKLIQSTRYSSIPDTIQVLGSVLNIPSGDKVNVSTFIKYTYASPASCQESYFSMTLAFNDSASDLYFYNPDTSSNYYTVYNAAYELTNEQTANQLINDYYETGSITQEKLDSIEQKLISVGTKIDITNDKLDDVNDKLDDIYETMNDTSLNTGQLENSAGWLPAGPVDSILNLPLSLYENLLDILQNGQSCPVLQINLPFVNETLSIPCLSDIFNRIEGLNVFWTWVGTISGAFLLFNYLINLYKWVDATLTMRENNHFGGY